PRPEPARASSTLSSRCLGRPRRRLRSGGRRVRRRCDRAGPGGLPGPDRRPSVGLMADISAARTGRRLFGEPRVEEAGPGVHVARAFDLGNVIKIATREGPVIVDTASARASAAAARDALAEASPGEPRYVVYTHCHNDHTSGAEALVADATAEV